ncbi:MFS transporter [Actinopolymorpha pittospori]|uniref:Putative proline/betaine transporter n=1 Tax=Actinopolymorpha pittospori TaxID=648752 RepID=A0A927MXK7_9ACTN|nr:MFS transporter [Actinopolymorpha pittospori]MBE1607148.1 metabolite-proton symporter [Actinopolymorpha pittospori]
MTSLRHGHEPATDGSAAQRRRAVVSSTLGSSIEWYDFYLYGVAAATIFNHQFFPAGTSPYVGTLLAFSTYAVGFLARPLGGLVFGHFGDRVGRKKALVVTILMMGGATFLCGLLPTYAAIGIWAPLALTALRFLQGIGVGGEWGGATLMVTEQSPARRRGLFGALPQLGVAFGALTSNGLFSLISATMDERSFQAWGWRLPFLFSAVLVAIGLYIRLSLAESPAFQQLREEGKIEKKPIVTVLRQQPLTILRVAGIRVADIGNYYVWTSFVLAYAVTIGLSSNDILVPTLIVSAVSLLTIPMWGAISDRLGRRRTIMVGGVVMAALSYPFFWAVDTRNWSLILLVLLIGINLGRDACYAPQAAYFTEMFPAQVRYSGASIGPQLAAVFGGCAPLIATALAGPDFGGIAQVVGLVVVMSLVTFVAALASKETAFALTGRDAAAVPAAGGNAS